MRRREFITLLGGTAVAWPLMARAQQSAKPSIGFLSTRGAGSAIQLAAAFRQGLKEVGFVESQNLSIEYRWAEGQLGCGLIKPEPKSKASDFEHGEVVEGAPVVSGRDVAKLLEFVEAPFDQIASFVFSFAVGDPVVAV